MWLERGRPSDFVVEKPPSARALSLSKQGKLGVVDLCLGVPDLLVSWTPFLENHKVTVGLGLSSQTCPLGVDFARCNRLRRACVCDISKKFGASHSLTAADRKCLSSRVVATNSKPVFRVADIG
jgi:hypothetical protein